MQCSSVFNGRCVHNRFQVSPQVKLQMDLKAKQREQQSLGVRLFKTLFQLYGILLELFPTLRVTFMFQ